MACSKSVISGLIRSVLVRQPPMLTTSPGATASGVRLLSLLPSNTDPKEFRPKRALILTKVSRYEFEKHRLIADNAKEQSSSGTSGSASKQPQPQLSEDDFIEALRRRGSDYETMKRHHIIHKSTESKVREALEAKGIEVKVIQRFSYDTNLIDWADVVFTTGGDGTFLLGASKITNRHKPVIGINTDPNRSEGHLCLPKRCSEDVGQAVEAVLNGRFKWMFRRRLRVTVTGDQNKIYAPAVEIHNQQLQYPEYRYIDLLSEQSVNASDHPLTAYKSGRAVNGGRTKLSSRVLPVLALNEVFLGESLSSRVSYLEVKFDSDSDFIKSRNSGLCISTGTGSTSWTYNINKLTEQSVASLLRIMTANGMCADIKDKCDDASLIEKVTSSFNNELIFDPEENRMSYTIRDPISMQGASDLARMPRGKASRIEVKSKCFEASLVIDGSLSYKFNDGTHASVDIWDEDALRTVQLTDDHQ